MKKSRRSSAPTALAAVLLAVALGAVWAQASLTFRIVTVRQNRPGYWKGAAAYPQFRGDLAIVKPANRATVKNMSAELASDLIISPGGITFLLPPYAVAPYSEGSFFVKVPFAEFGGKLNPDGPLKGLLPTM